MSKDFKAVFFDMDGVVVDSIPYHFVSWFEVLKKYGVHLDPMLMLTMEGSKYEDFLIPAFSKYNKELTPEIIKTLPQEREYLSKKYFKRYIFEGIEEFINHLKNQNILIGLVTGAVYGQVQRILPKELLDLFGTIVTADDVKKGKPDPEPYLTAANNLKVDTRHCLVIENAPYGIRAAKAAGMSCYAIATSLPKDYLSQADNVFETHEELLNTLNNVF